MTDHERFEQIMSALLEVQDKGREIVPDVWGIDPRWRSSGNVWVPLGDCLCPLAALLLVSQIRAELGQKTAAATALETTSHWVSGFLAGFDNYASMLFPDPGAAKRAGWKVAQWVRRELGLQRLRWPGR